MKDGGEPSINIKYPSLSTVFTDRTRNLGLHSTLISLFTKKHPFFNLQIKEILNI